VLGAIPAAAIYLKFTRTSQAAGFALLATVLPLGHAFGRVGCWFRGCCFGKSATHALAFGGQYPVQLYEAAGDVLIFAVLLLRFLRLSRGGRQVSSRELVSISALYLMLYPVFRFATEMLRGDTRRGLWCPTDWPALARVFGFGAQEPVLWSTSQLISLVLMVVGVGLWVGYVKKGQSP